MSFTDTLPADISALEKLLGRKIEVGALPLIKKIAEKADIFTERGRQHATEGVQPWTEEDFEKWGRKQFGEAKEDEIVSLMYKCYMEGYNAGKDGLI